MTSINPLFDSFPERRGTCSAKWDGMAEGVIPMQVADMDFRSPQCVIDALKARADHGMFGYSFAGDAFFEAACGWQARVHGCTVNKEEILPAAGVITGLQWAMKALTPEGGCVILLPSYPPFMSVPENLSKPLHPVTMPNQNGRWELPLEALERELSREDVNAFILCNPHNPTGRIWTREELCSMLSLCKKHGVTVYSDEIHGDIILPGEEFVSVLSLPEELAGEAVVLNAPSKTFNLPGLQTSCMIVRNPAQRKKIAELMGRNHVPGPDIMGFAAATAAYVLGLPGQAVSQGLASFTGAGRRFEYKGTYHGAKIYDDYAHHPGELHALLQMARSLGYQRIICAFQPHTYSRTRALFDDFVRELQAADVVLLAEIYAAREKNTIGISSKDLAAQLPGSIYCPTLEDVTHHLRTLARDGDLILTVGAGNIYTAGEALLH